MSPRIELQYRCVSNIAVSHHLLLLYSVFHHFTRRETPLTRERLSRDTRFLCALLVLQCGCVSAISIFSWEHFPIDVLPLPSLEGDQRGTRRAYTDPHEHVRAHPSLLSARPVESPRAGYKKSPRAHTCRAVQIVTTVMTPHCSGVQRAHAHSKCGTHKTSYTRHKYTSSSHLLTFSCGRDEA